MKMFDYQSRKERGTLFSDEFLNRLEKGNKLQQDLYHKLAGEYRLNKCKVENYLPKSKYVIDDILLDPEAAELVASSEFVINRKDIIKKFYYRFQDGFFLVTTTNGNKEFFTRVSTEEVKKQLQSDPDKYFEIFPQKKSPDQKASQTEAEKDSGNKEKKNNKPETAESHMMEDNQRFDFEPPKGGFLFPKKYEKRGDI